MYACMCPIGNVSTVDPRGFFLYQRFEIRSFDAEDLDK